MAGLQICKVINRSNSIGCGPTIGPQKLRRNHCHIPVHTSHTGTVSTLTTNCTGHVSAVIIIHRVVNAVIVAFKIPTVNVIDISVSVVIDAIDSVVRVRPDVIDQVRVSDLNACIDNSHKNRLRARLSIVPCRFGIDTINVRRASRPDWSRAVTAFHTPQLTIRIICVVTDR